jgi:hypothetical protein
MQRIFKKMVLTDDPPAEPPPLKRGARVPCSYLKLFILSPEWGEDYSPNKEIPEN